MSDGMQDSGHNTLSDAHAHDLTVHFLVWNALRAATLIAKVDLLVRYSGMHMHNVTV